MRTHMELSFVRAPSARLCMAALALFLVTAPQPARASTGNLVTATAGLAAQAAVLFNNKTGLVTPSKLVEADDFAYPSKLAWDAKKAGLGIKCGAGVGMCPMGHCCRCV